MIICEYLEWCIFQSVTQACSEKRNLSSPNGGRSYDLTITSSDALLLSYRRLVGANAIKLGSWDKHPAYSWDLNVDVWQMRIGINMTIFLSLINI